MTQAAPSSAEVQLLRERFYNATATRIQHVHGDLAILRVLPDGGGLSFQPGQYTVLGLGYWESRLPGTQQETLTDADRGRLARRAYSISCALLDQAGKLVRSDQSDELEFYVALVRSADHPPALTPRLFMLSEGDRIHLARKCYGHYGLGEVRTDDTVVFMATGTGEAPHNAMLADLIARAHRGPVLSVVCNRYENDHGYLEAHRRLEDMYRNYRYLPLTTRERWNIDHNDPNYVGKRYIQDYFASGDLESDAGMEIRPGATHVYLCGSPDMIGLPVHGHGSPSTFPLSTGMAELLSRRGFKLDRPGESGNVHFEKYW